MNTIDFIIIGIVLGSGFIGLLRGFVREVLSILTWVGAAAITYYLFYHVSFIRDFTQSHIANQQIADGVAIAVLFIVSLIVCSIVSGILSDLVRRSTLDGIDSSLGMAFGLGRGVVLIAICEIVFSAFTPRQNQSESIQNARFTPLTRQIADKLIEMLPLNARSFILSQANKNVAPQPSTSQPQLTQGEMQPQTVSQPESKAIPNAMQPPIPQNEGAMPKQKPAVTGEGDLTKTTPPLNVPPPQTILPVLPGTSQKQSAQPPALQDSQKTAEALANLKPQATDEKTKDTDYNQSQRHDMDRLFQTAQ